MRAIVAVDENWAIGKDNELLFHISEDLKRFKDLTTGCFVIMGRNTFESLPNQKPLIGRINIVLSRNLDFKQSGFITLHSLSDVLYLQKNILNDDDLWVIGGEKIYNLLLPYCNEVFLTKVHTKVDGANKFFPNLDKLDDWNWSHKSGIIHDDKTNLDYEFIHYYNEKYNKDIKIRL